MWSLPYGAFKFITISVLHGLEGDAGDAERMSHAHCAPVWSDLNGVIDILSRTRLTTLYITLENAFFGDFSIKKIVSMPWCGTSRERNHDAIDFEVLTLPFQRLRLLEGKQVYFARMDYRQMDMKLFVEGQLVGSDEDVHPRLQKAMQDVLDVVRTPLLSEPLSLAQKKKHSKLMSRTNAWTLGLEQALSAEEVDYSAHVRKLRYLALTPGHWTRLHDCITGTRNFRYRDRASLTIYEQRIMLKHLRDHKRAWRTFIPQPFRHDTAFALQLEQQLFSNQESIAHIPEIQKQVLVERAAKSVDEIKDIPAWETAAFCRFNNNSLLQEGWFDEDISIVTNEKRKASEVFAVDNDLGWLGLWQA
ncbi:MAG: hypothetical protein Q9162_005062 [Coniocarpon cinnabarinum]